MNYRHEQTRRQRQRGVTIYCVIVTIAVLAILSYNIIGQALTGYWHGAQVRDAIVLQQLTDSALAQALFHLNRGDQKAAAAPVREPFGVAQIELGEGKQDRTIRVTAHAPNAEYPRGASRILFRLVRDAKGRWSVASAAHEPIPAGG